MFDAYVSLGNNCETAYQMRRVLGRDDSSFFSWNVSMFKPLISILSSNFEGILKLENLSNDPATGLMFDASHNFNLHSPFTTKEFWTESGFDLAFEDFKSKMSHLADKFSRLAASGQRIAYFYKTEEQEDTREYSKQLCRLLEDFHQDQNFALVIVQKNVAFESPWLEKLIYNRYLARTAPWNDATDGHVSSWDKIFREFPHAAGLRLAGY